MGLKLESTTKVCSRCKKDKSLNEFYKQKDRYESLCKKCKKEARINREREFETKGSQSDNKDLSRKLFPTDKSVEGREFYDFEIACLPELDESIFYPDKKIVELGLDKDDVTDLLGFLQWHLEQKNKRLKNKLEEDL